jgi:hypothetical protein
MSKFHAFSEWAFRYDSDKQFRHNSGIFQQNIFMREGSQHLIRNAKGMQVCKNREISIDQKKLKRGQNHPNLDLYNYYIGVRIKGATPTFLYLIYLCIMISSTPYFFAKLQVHVMIDLSPLSFFCKGMHNLWGLAPHFCCKDT